MKQALHAAMEAPPQAETLLALLAELADSGEVSASQLQRGFQRRASLCALAAPPPPLLRET